MITDQARRATDKQLKEMEKHLTKVYQRAGKELAKKHESYFTKFAEQDKAKLKQVQDGLLSKEKYAQWRAGKIAMGDHWKKMQEQAAMDLYNVNRIATDYINDKVPDIYALNYNFSAKDIEKGVSRKITFEMANSRAVKELATNGDSGFYLPKKKLDPKKDIPWNMKQVNAEILQGIYQGESVDKMAKRLMNVGVRNGESAIRAARTIVTTVENKARQDAAEAAEEKGVIMKKVWLTISDDRTREWHVQAGIDYGSDANAIPIDEPFIVNDEEMMYPGDESLGASPSNIYNCRCSRRNITVGFKSILPPDKQGKIKVSFGDWGDEDDEGDE